MQIAESDMLPLNFLDPHVRATLECGTELEYYSLGIDSILGMRQRQKGERNDGECMCIARA
jgi:hypothetical protein